MKPNQPAIARSPRPEIAGSSRHQDLGCATAVTPRQQPIPAEVADIQRSLTNLHESIETLFGALASVTEVRPTDPEVLKDAPLPSNLHGDITSIHRSVRVAISRIDGIRASLLV